MLSSDDLPYRIVTSGRFDAAKVRVEVVGDTRDERLDEDLAGPWQREKQRLGGKLFDGAMCRYESHEIVDSRLVLRVSRTSYRVFVETNLFGPRDLPTRCLCNPVGVSATLRCGDDVLLFGRRGDGVAYYPRRLHPFAGSLDWPDNAQPIDVFAECRRELHEELSLTTMDVPTLAVVGLVEDVDLRHPEVVLHAETPLSSDEVAARLDAAEHAGVERVADEPAAVERASRDERFTPVARASMRLRLAGLPGEPVLP
jgi:hypothetical protein